MSQTITLQPVTRIEGHLSLHAETEPVEANGKKGFKVTKAYCDGEMFRGIENILVGRDPLDAQQITQRICGVCPISHALASIRAQEMAYGIKPVNNGRLLQNLILAANYIQSHVLHFYHLAALDFVDVKAVLSYTGPNATLDGTQAVDRRVPGQQRCRARRALPAAFRTRLREESRRQHGPVGALCRGPRYPQMCHEMAAVFAGRMPHATSLVPGGVTQTPTIERILEYRSRLEQAAQFVENVYLGDLLRVAKRFPSTWISAAAAAISSALEVFPWTTRAASSSSRARSSEASGNRSIESAILEDATNSRYRQSVPLHPSRGETRPEPHKKGAYTWLMAPRYRGEVVERRRPWPAC